MITGLILAASIPTGVSTFVWVSMYKGNIALTLSIILIDTMLAPFLVPGILSLLVGTDVQLDVYDMMSSLFWMIVVPSLIGMILNEWSKGAIAPVWGPRLNPFSKLTMAAIVAINGSVVAPILRISACIWQVWPSSSWPLLLRATCSAWPSPSSWGGVMPTESRSSSMAACVTSARGRCWPLLIFLLLLPFRSYSVWYSSK